MVSIRNKIKIIDRDNNLTDFELKTKAEAAEKKKKKIIQYYAS